MINLSLNKYILNQYNNVHHALKIFLYGIEMFENSSKSLLEQKIQMHKQNLAYLPVV